MIERNMKRVDLIRELSSRLKDFRERFPIITLPKGSLLVKPQDARDKLFLIKSGKVQVYKITAEGKQCTLSILNKGDIFGETQFLVSGPREVYASALTGVSLYLIDGQVFREILEKKPAIALKVLEWTNLRLEETEELLEKIAYGDAKTRILYQLLKLCDNFGIYEEGHCKLGVKLTHQDLANMVAVSRETVTHTLNRLAKEGMITNRQRFLTVKCEEIRKLLLNA